jgi:Fe-S cluster biogenesis protein NfuA/nitrite reductase/ring-hydroxylating ferredoxin subunit
MDFEKAAAELDALVGTLEREGDQRALMLLELIDAIHRPALELIARGERDHPIARAVLEMYDLSEPAGEILAEEALDQVRPYVESHGGHVELVEVDGGVVHVTMGGACHGCAASAMTLRRGIEEALRAHYPEFEEVVAHEPEGEPAPAPALLQIEGAPPPRRPQFVAVDAGGVESGGMAARDVDGVALLLVNVQGEVYAFRNACRVDDLPLDGGRLAESVIVCPWHNCAYDARTGKRVDDEDGEGLAVVPVAMKDGLVQVAVNVA